MKSNASKGLIDGSVGFSGVDAVDNGAADDDAVD